MWMIADRLRRFRPKLNITGGEARLESFRVFTGKDNDFDDNHVTVGPAARILPGSGSFDETALVNGHDVISVQIVDTILILNALIDIFDFYRQWETELLHAADSKDFQRMVDVSHEVFLNPIIVVDAVGSVIGLSTVFGPDDLDELWAEIYRTGAVPISILSKPLETAKGESVMAWTFEPVEYFMPSGKKNIGAFLGEESEVMGSLSVWENETPFHPGHRQLAREFCRIAGFAIKKNDENSSVLPKSAILNNLLTGREVDDDYLTRLAGQFRPPWQLLVVRNYFRLEKLHMNSLIDSLRKQDFSCLPIMYDNDAVILAMTGVTPKVTDLILRQRDHDKSYYTIGISLPFFSFYDIPVWYRQALFALDKAARKPGVYRCEDYALDYLTSSLIEHNAAMRLTHPALGKLREYDRETNGDLYETLFKFLLHERSWVKSSAALNIHRNSLVYRVQRIESLLGLDLDDPMTRFYLLLSFFIDKKSQNRHK
jgi:hypothetical protein